MKIQALCTNQLLAKKQHFCAAMLENVREVYQLKGCVEPDKAASFIMAHNLRLVRLLEWGDVPEDQDPYTGSLRSFDQLSDYPVPLRRELYRSVMRGIPLPTESKVGALRYALGLQDDVFDPCCFRRLDAESKTIRKMILTCLPSSPYKGGLLKRLCPRLSSASVLRSKGCKISLKVNVNHKNCCESNLGIGTMRRKDTLYGDAIMNVVGQIAKDLFQTYGEMLTQTGKTLRKNRKKILGWTAGVAAAAAATCYGGTPVIVAEIGAGLAVAGCYLATFNDSFFTRLSGAAVCCLGVSMLQLSATSAYYEIKYGQPYLTEIAVRKASATVRENLQSGTPNSTTLVIGNEYLKLGHFAPVKVQKSITGAVECFNTDTQLLLNINNNMEYYTRHDPKAKWKPVSATDFPYALACGNGS